MNSTITQSYIATAFLSTSLHKEDKPAVEFVAKLLRMHGIKPIGTVGLYDASAENPTTLMKKNIPNADFIVIVATPRYVQTDLRTGKRTLAISEMLHVESGMAFAYNKPVLVFVINDTHIGSFLPNITQYITLTGRREDLKQKIPLIKQLLNNTLQKVREVVHNESVQRFGNLLKTGLAVYGLFKLIEPTPNAKRRSTFTKKQQRTKRKTTRTKTSHSNIY